MLSFAVTKLPPRLLPGRDSQFRGVFAPCFNTFAICNVGAAFWPILHVPGFLNDVADGLSRSEDPSSLGFAEAEKVAPPWREFLVVPFKPQVALLEAELAPFLPAL